MAAAGASYQYDAAPASGESASNKMPFFPFAQIHRTIIEVSRGSNLLQIILPLVAIAISIGTAVLTFFQWYLEGRRVVVEAQTATLVEPPASRSAIMLSVTNYGRIPAVVRHWGFYSSKEVYSASPGMGSWSAGPDLPHTLEPGASQVWWLDYREQKSRLEAQHPGGIYLLRGFATMGTRKRKASRTFINLSNGIPTPANPVKRRIQRMRNRRGVAVLIAGKMGSDQSFMSLTRIGLRLALTAIRVDVVQDQQGDQPARVLADSLIEQRFWGRKKIIITVPDELLDMPGSCYRIRWRLSRTPHEERHGISSPEDQAHLRGIIPTPSS